MHVQGSETITPEGNKEIIAQVLATNTELQRRFGSIKYLVEISDIELLTDEMIAIILKNSELIDFDKAAYYSIPEDLKQRLMKSFSASSRARNFAFFEHKEDAIKWLQATPPLTA